MRKFFLVAIFLVVFSSLATVAKSPANEIAPRFTITDLTAGLEQKFQHVSANGANNNGDIVGAIDGRAFLWRKGKINFIGQLPGSRSCGATDINDAGKIVGACSFGEWDNKYFFWQNGKMQTLGSVPLLIGKIAINQRGEVLLHIKDKRKVYAALWHSGQRKSLGNWWPWALNDKGEVAGVRILPDVLDSKGRPKNRNTMSAVVWQNGVAVSAGKAGSMAVLLNNHHDLVLWEEDYWVSPAVRRSFLVRDGKKTQLGEFEIFERDRPRLVEVAMNERCQILGLDLASRGAFLWQDGAWTNLQDCIPPSSGWVLEIPRDINQSGQIVGTGTLNGKQRAFLLTPIP